MPTNRSVFKLRAPAAVPALALASGIFLLASAIGAQAPEGPQNPPPPASQAAPPAPTSASPMAPHSTKLVLKDGSIQLVREYHVEGDRMRFYSLDGSQWEEMPAALVDWDATKKLEADEAQRQTAIVKKAHTQEEAQRFQSLDIDASIEVAPGIFLPPGEGLFVLDSKAVLQLTEIPTNSNLSKGKAVEKVIVPIPVVPIRHTVSLTGTRARLRVRAIRPEFYMRSTEPRQPELRLIRASIRNNARNLENLDLMYGGQQRETAHTVPIQLWQVAQGVYRFTLGAALEPGEYALAESVREPDGNISLTVWDFGVDAGGARAKPK